MEVSSFQSPLHLYVHFSTDFYAITITMIVLLNQIKTSFV